MMQDECAHLQSELAALKLVHVSDNFPSRSADGPVSLGQFQVTLVEIAK